MNPDQLLSLAQQHLQSQNRDQAKRLLRQVLQMAPDHIQAGLSLVTLELQDQQAAAAMDILSGLWKRTRNPMVADVMADLGSSVSRAAAQEQKNDRKVIEHIAGLLKAVQGSKKIVIDILQYSFVGGQALDAFSLVPIYQNGIPQRTGKTMVFFSGNPANTALLELISRQLPTVRDYQFHQMGQYTEFNWTTRRYVVNEKFRAEFLGRHTDLFGDIIEFTTSSNGRAYCESDQEQEECLVTQRPRICFSSAEQEKGMSFLENILKLPDNAWFACIYARDGAYYNESPQSPNWFRNADINTYLPAVDEILARGGHVVRVGEKTIQCLTHTDPRVFDYSNSKYRDPFLDIYLLAKCRFFLGTPSGYSHVTLPFGTPQVLVNAVNCNGGRCAVWIPKKMVDTRTNRPLPFAEFYQRYYGYGNTGMFAENGINQEKLLHVRHVDNSPEEIAAAAVEMMNRLDGIHVESAQAEMMREKFKPVCLKWNLPFEKGPVASCFLEAFPELFSPIPDSRCVLTQAVIH